MFVFVFGLIVCCGFCLLCVFVWMCLIGCFECVLCLLFVCVRRGIPHVLLLFARLCYCGVRIVSFVLFVCFLFGVFPICCVWLIGSRRRCVVYVLMIDQIFSPCVVVFCLFVVNVMCACVLFVFGKVYPSVLVCVVQWCVVFLSFFKSVFVWWFWIGCFNCVLCLLYGCDWRGIPHVLLLSARLCYCGIPHLLFVLFVFVLCVSHALCLVAWFTSVLCCLCVNA